MEENHINDKIGIIKSLSRRDLLLLSLANLKNGLAINVDDIWYKDDDTL